MKTFGPLIVLCLAGLTLAASTASFPRVRGAREVNEVRYLMQSDTVLSSCANCVVFS